MSKQSPAQQQIDELRKRLEALHASVLDRKQRVDKDLNRDSGPIPADFSEQATAVENDETLVAIQAELGLQLTQIEHAQERLGAGTYGICDSCQQQISEARLEAMPTATSCINCASL